MKAQEIASRAAELVSGSRQQTHGDKLINHQNIASLWNAYLGWRLGEGCLISAHDVALMMILLKVARTKEGEHNPDDYIDAAGYAAVAGEIAARRQK